MTYGDRYTREDRGEESHPYYRPSRPHEAGGGSGGFADEGDWRGGRDNSRGYEARGSELAPVDVDPEPLPAASREKKRRSGRRKHMPLWQELPLLLIVAFCLAVLIRTFLLQAFYIPSGSMEDTLRVRDRVLVNKVVYDMRSPERGEIVVFQGTESWAPENLPDPDIGFFARLGRTVGDLVGISQPGEKDFIKRIIGLPGDVVSCCDPNGRLYVNGYPLDEPYVTENAPLEGPSTGRDCRSRRFDPVTVEPGHMFVMGDHRLVSQDSRCQGQVPIDNVIGRAFVIVWPNSHWSGLGVPDTFKNVPKPYAAGPPGPARVPYVPAETVVAVFALLIPARTRLMTRPSRRRLAA